MTAKTIVVLIAASAHFCSGEAVIPEADDTCLNSEDGCGADFLQHTAKHRMKTDEMQMSEQSEEESEEESEEFEVQSNQSAPPACCSDSDTPFMISKKETCATLGTKLKDRCTVFRKGACDRLPDEDKIDCGANNANACEKADCCWDAQANTCFTGRIEGYCEKSCVKAGFKKQCSCDPEPWHGKTEPTCRGGKFQIGATSPATRGPYLSHDGGQVVDLWHTNSANQEWELEQTCGNAYYIKAVSPAGRGPYLSHDDKQVVDLWKEAGANQVWKITQASGETKGTYTIEVTSPASRGPYLSHDGGQAVDLYNTLTGNQKWIIPGFSCSTSSTPGKGTCKGPKTYRIVATSSADRGPYLSHDGGHVVDLWNQASANQEWVLEQDCGNGYRIKAVSPASRGPYLSHDDGQVVDLWNQAHADQVWKIGQASGQPNGVYTIEVTTAAKRGPYLSHDKGQVVDLYNTLTGNQYWSIPGFTPSTTTCGR